MRVRLKRTVKAAVTACALAGALTWVLTAGGSQDHSAQDAATAVKAVANEAPGYIVENFDYPGADRILAERGITLKRGDGHIVLADCGSETGLLEVRARTKGTICFRVTGNSGYLAMEIPSVYGVKGNDYTTQVDMTVDSEETSYDIAKNAWTPVGETADEEERKWMLMEIRTSK